MKKLIYSVGLRAWLLVVVVGLSSCNKEKEPAILSDFLVGKWEFSYQRVESNGLKTLPTYDFDYYVLFNSDGTITHEKKLRITSTGGGELLGNECYWKVVGDKLALMHWFTGKETEFSIGGGQRYLELKQTERQRKEGMQYLITMIKVG